MSPRMRSAVTPTTAVLLALCEMNVSTYVNSFQVRVKPKSAAHTTPGTAMGRTTRMSVCILEAPSTRAHSSTSLGIVRKYPMSSHVEKGTRKVGEVTISAQIVSEIPSHTTTWESGRNRSGGGTRYVMNTAVPKAFTPRKRS